MPRFFKKPLPVQAHIITDEEITVRDRDGRVSAGRAGWVSIIGPEGEQYSMRPGRFVRYFDPDPNDKNAAAMMNKLREPKE